MLLIKKNIEIKDIQKCLAGDGWDFGNEILYDMCRKHPEHNSAEEIIGKLWLIGRSYAAAIERRKNINELFIGDDFYFKVVAPKMIEIGPELDKRILALKKYDSINSGNLRDIVETHSYLTNIFSEITGLEKRSLASKYLHFHAPKMFYIYDSRSIRGAKKYVAGDKQLRASLAPFGDKEYIELVIRLFTIQGYVKNQHDVLVSPRDMDRFILNY